MHTYIYIYNRTVISLTTPINYLLMYINITFSLLIFFSCSSLIHSFSLALIFIYIILNERLPMCMIIETIMMTDNTARRSMSISFVRQRQWRLFVKVMICFFILSDIYIRRSMYRKKTDIDLFLRLLVASIVIFYMSDNSARTSETWRSVKNTICYDRSSPRKSLMYKSSIAFVHMAVFDHFNINAIINTLFLIFL